MKRKKKKVQSSVGGHSSGAVVSPGSTYRPTEEEQAKLREHQARGAANLAPPIRLAVNAAGQPYIIYDHPSQTVGRALLAEALGTADNCFIDGLLLQLINAGSRDEQLDPAGINFMLAVIKGIKPEDQFVAMLAAQFAAVHMATLNFAWQLPQTQYSPSHQETVERGLNRLARTSAMLMETLKRYRTGGQQTVTVQHLTVGEGGKAIVGNVTNPARDSSSQNTSTPVPALTDARQVPMQTIDNPARVPATSQRRRKN
jgi:hypothetical protein